MIIRTLVRLLIEPKGEARGKQNAIPKPHAHAPPGGKPPAELRYAVPDPTARRSAHLRPVVAKLLRAARPASLIRDISKRGAETQPAPPGGKPPAELRLSFPNASAPPSSASVFVCGIRLFINMRAASGRLRCFGCLWPAGLPRTTRYGFFSSKPCVRPGCLARPGLSIPTNKQPSYWTD